MAWDAALKGNSEGTAVTPPAKAGRREWTELGVIALPCLVHATDLTVLNLALHALNADLQPTSSQMLWIVDICREPDPRLRAAVHDHLNQSTPTKEDLVMLANAKAYSGFAVDDLRNAREFYGGTLGLRTSEEYDLMWLHLAGDRDTLVYPQPDPTPASYTILNFEVDDIEQAVDELVARGVRFERYDGIEQDQRGIFRGEGPYIAWFKDPAGNVLSVLQER